MAGVPCNDTMSFQIQASMSAQNNTRYTRSLGLLLLLASGSQYVARDVFLWSVSCYVQASCKGKEVSTLSLFRFTHVGCMYSELCSSLTGLGGGPGRSTLLVSSSLHSCCAGGCHMYKRVCVRKGTASVSAQELQFQRSLSYLQHEQHVVALWGNIRVWRRLRDVAAASSSTQSAANKHWHCCCALKLTGSYHIPSMSRCLSESQSSVLSCPQHAAAAERASHTA
jgi:hypothetical protein